MPTVAILALVERQAEETFNAVERAGFPLRDLLEVEFKEHWDEVKEALKREHPEIDEGRRVSVDTRLGPQVRAALKKLNKWWRSKQRLLRQHGF